MKKVKKEREKTNKVEYKRGWDEIFFFYDQIEKEEKFQNLPVDIVRERKEENAYNE